MGVRMLIGDWTKVGSWTKAGGWATGGDWTKAVGSATGGDWTKAGPKCSTARLGRRVKQTESFVLGLPQAFSLQPSEPPFRP